MGFINENQNPDPFPGETGNRKNRNESKPQDLAATAGTDDAISGASSPDLMDDTERAARERLRLIRERIARGFYDRPGVKAKLAERMTGSEEFAQAWQDAVNEKPSREKDDINPPQSDSGAEDSETQTSENI